MIQPASPDAGPALPGLARVLVVDPDDAVCALLKDALELELGFRVRIACTGHAAHLALQEHGIDLVLIDELLPGTPGTAAVTAHADKLGIPVILMAADAALVRPRRGVVRGVLDKPFRVGELARLIDATLAIARARENRVGGASGSNPETRH